ncbi:MAG: hypothetical protein QM570_15420 [Planctomycetota bacterium]|jgi:hypothetical protein|nr:hypothetical protein [Planctomycetota bacterium]
MSIKRYCHMCGVEMPDVPNLRQYQRRPEPGKCLVVKVTHCWNGTWNGGDICDACLEATVKHEFKVHE